MEAVTEQRQKRRVQDSKQSASTYDTDYDLNNSQWEDSQDEAGAHFDDSLIREFLARNYAFLGEEGCQKVRNSFVIIVGLGGVGSTCAAMLARSGVGKIR